MRLLILILLFPFIAQGQIVRTHPYYKPPVSGCSYLLDQYSGAAAAYSLRKLDCDYAGSAIRVRRSSDNTEQDIGFVNGNLDTASLKTFVGTGGTDDGFVVTWYDQSGNGRNASESTAGNQPKIMDNGVIYRVNSKPAVYFLNTSDNILTTTFTGFTISTASVFIVVTPEAGDADSRFFSMVGTGNDYDKYVPAITNTTGSIGAYTNGAYRAMVTGFSSTVLNLFTGISDGTKVKNSRNNGTDVEYTYTTPSHTVSRFTIGASAYQSGLKTDGNMKGYMVEVVFYNSDKTSDKGNINGNINTYYSVY